MKRHSLVHPFTISDGENSDSMPPLSTSFNPAAFSKNRDQSSVPTGDDVREPGISVPYTKTAVFEAFKPILRSLQVAGFYHVDNNESSSTRWRLWLSRAYCWIVALGCLLLFVLNIAALRDASMVGTVLFTRLNNVVSLALVVVDAASFIAASHSRKALEKFFICYNRLHMYGGPYVTYKWLRMFLTAFCVSCWIALIPAMIFFSIVTTLDPSYSLFAVVLEAKTYGPGATFLNILFMAYISACWTFNACLELSLAIIIYRETTLFARALKKKYTNTANTFVLNNISVPQNTCNDLEQDRKRYLEITRIVKAADRSLSLHQAGAFGINVASICLQVYNICYYPDGRVKPNAGATYTFGLLLCVSDIVITCTSGILVVSGVCCALIITTNCLISLMCVLPARFISLIQIKGLTRFPCYYLTRTTLNMTLIYLG